jgi:hypothetical protein
VSEDQSNPHAFFSRPPTFSKIFTPYLTSTYELYPPQAESTFRNIRASSPNYREPPFRGSLALFMGRFEKLIIEARVTSHGSTNNERFSKKLDFPNKNKDLPEI